MSKKVKTKIRNRIEDIDLDPVRYKLYQRRPCRMENMYVMRCESTRSENFHSM